MEETIVAGEGERERDGRRVWMRWRREDERKGEKERMEKENKATKRRRERANDERERNARFRSPTLGPGRASGKESVEEWEERTSEGRCSKCTEGRKVQEECLIAWAAFSQIFLGWFLFLERSKGMQIIRERASRVW